ncbi:DUF362 domain-containing protein [Candidatus Fermentibacteria bacterium]|nr:DUF362 domain-containing protein [Candidatus Fermentibacteria bacterium]
MKRREFLKQVSAGIAVVGCAPSSFADNVAPLSSVTASMTPQSSLARARGADPEAMTHAAVERLGGMRTFVHRGDKVVIKPNVGWDRPFAIRANTHPDVVKALARMVIEAEAAEVRIVDFPVMGQNPRNAFEASGMNAVGAELGIPVYPVCEASGFVDITLPGAEVLKTARVIRELLEADVILNVPVAKSHGCTKFTGALKNWMGIVWSRAYFHQNFTTDSRSSPAHWNHIASCIAEIQQRIPPTLAVIDALAIMKTGGPQGPGELENVGEILAGTDQVALDTYAVSLFDTIELGDVISIHRAAQLGLGTSDLSRVAIWDA